MRDLLSIRSRPLIILTGVLVVLLLCAFVSQYGTNPWVETKLCVGCSDCVAHCPTGAISVVDGKAIIDNDKCINCKFCVQTCSYRAVRTPK